MAKKYEDIINSVEDNLKNLTALSGETQETISKSDNEEAEVEVEATEDVEVEAEQAEAETEEVEEADKAEDVEKDEEDVKEEDLEENAEESVEDAEELAEAVEEEAEKEEADEKLEKSETVEEDTAEEVVEVEETLEKSEKEVEALETKVEEVEAKLEGEELGGTVLAEAQPVSTEGYAKPMEVMAEAISQITDVLATIKADIASLKTVETVSKSMDAVEPEGKSAVLPVEREKLSKSDVEEVEETAQEVEEVEQVDTFNNDVEEYFFAKGNEMTARDVQSLRTVVLSARHNTLTDDERLTGEEIMKKYSK